MYYVLKRLIYMIFLSNDSSFNTIWQTILTITVQFCLYCLSKKLCIIPRRLSRSCLMIQYFYNHFLFITIFLHKEYIERFYFFNEENFEKSISHSSRILLSTQTSKKVVQKFVKTLWMIFFLKFHILFQNWSKFLDKTKQF